MASEFFDAERAAGYQDFQAALDEQTRPASWPSSGGPSLRVNVVAPGVTLVGMARSSVEAGKYDPAVRDQRIPRLGRPEDVARVIRLLLEPDNYITGQVITVDGGLTLRRDRG